MEETYASAGHLQRECRDFWDRNMKSSWQALTMKISGIASESVKEAMTCLS